MEEFQKLEACRIALLADSRRRKKKENAYYINRVHFFYALLITFGLKTCNINKNDSIF